MKPEAKTAPLEASATGDQWRLWSQFDFKNDSSNHHYDKTMIPTTHPNCINITICSAIHSSTSLIVSLLVFCTEGDF